MWKNMSKPIEQDWSINRNWWPQVQVVLKSYNKVGANIGAGQAKSAL